MLRPVVCPSCGGPKWPQYKLCRKCRNKERNGTRWPHYHGNHPMKQCPDCGTWIQKSSKTCLVCYLRRRVQERCVHYWDIGDDNYGTCLKCGAEKQFPTLREQMEQMDRRRIHNNYGVLVEA